MKLHIDTDIGSNIDDLCALALVLAWRGAELTGITTVAEHQGRRAGYLHYVLALAGREDVDVAAGADVALNCYRQAPPLLDESRYWPVPIAPAPGPLDRALDLLRRSIASSATIVAIGPCTNLALLERREPGILRAARLFLMGGYIDPPRDGFPRVDHTRDSNFQIDVRSAYEVMQASVPTLVPISVTVETWLRRSYLPALEQAGPLAQLIARQAESFASDRHYEQRYGSTCAALPDDLIAFQHDPLTCAIALGWDKGIEMREPLLSLDFANGWLHQTESTAGLPARVVTRVDGAAFSDLWLATITR